MISDDHNGEKRAHRRRSRRSDGGKQKLRRSTRTICFRLGLCSRFSMLCVVKPLDNEVYIHIMVVCEWVWSLGRSDVNCFVFRRQPGLWPVLRVKKIKKSIAPSFLLGDISPVWRHFICPSTGLKSLNDDAAFMMPPP